MLDLLIVNPTAAHGISGGHPIYGDLGTSLIACEPPLWARLIAAYCLEHLHTVEILDAEALRLTPDDVAQRVVEAHPKLVALVVFGHQPSASTQQMFGAGETAIAIKALAGHIPIIIVGGHVAALPQRTLEEEAVNYACNSEGPVTIERLLAGDPPEKVPGLVYWTENDEVAINAAPPLLSVDELHGDAWHLLPMHAYVAHNWQCFGDLSKRVPYASIYTSLGCPYRCTFCCIQAPFSPGQYGNRYRMRKPESVVREILHLRHHYGVQTFKIIDEMFVLNERHYTAICEGLIAAKKDLSDINIWAYARIDTVKPHTLAMFKEAGIKWLALGIESGSAHVRDGADKALKNDDIVGVVRAIQAAGINVIGNYIFGLPDDDATTMQATLDLALDLSTDFANFYSAMAYPGSRLYLDSVSSGAILPASWRGYSQHNDDCRPLDTEHVSGKDVLAFRDAAFNTYFTDPGYLSMVEQKFGVETRQHVEQMTTYKLERKLLKGEIE